MPYIDLIYFQYNGKHCKQLHGTASGLPVSVVIAEIVMQHVEERALATCRQSIPLWPRYVDDIFIARFAEKKIKSSFNRRRPRRRHRT